MTLSVRTIVSSALLFTPFKQLPFPVSIAPGLGLLQLRNMYTCM
jgi:hypothetical protein